MKKTIKVISLLLVCIICIFCISGCGEQSDEIQIDNVVQALKNNGFSDAGTYVEENETRISLSSDEECYLTLKYTEYENITIDDVKYDYINQNIIYLGNVSPNTDLMNILRAVLPLYKINLSSINIDDLVNELLTEKNPVRDQGGVVQTFYKEIDKNIYCMCDNGFWNNGYKEIYIYNDNTKK